MLVSDSAHKEDKGRRWEIRGMRRGSERKEDNSERKWKGKKGKGRVIKRDGNAKELFKMYEMKRIRGGENRRGKGQKEEGGRTRERGGDRGRGKREREK